MTTECRESRSMTETLDETQVEEVTELAEPGDHDKFSHYAPKIEITMAMVTGARIRAICGKYWTPTRDGDKFPVCPDCREMYETLSTGEPRP